MPGYRGARALHEGGAEVAGRQKNADATANKAQRVRKAAEAARKAKERADAHEIELSTGVLRALDIGEMALLNRLNGEFPNRNIATIQDATKIGDGVVAARAMIAQDAAAFNLWAQNAMIRNAKIESLAVDKLSAGTFTAGQITLAGSGALKAGGITFNANGINMPSTLTEYNSGQELDRKITSGDWGEIYFYRTDIYQGLYHRSIGTGSRNALLLLEATRGVNSTYVLMQETSFTLRSPGDIKLYADKDIDIRGVRSSDGRRWGIGVNNNGQVYAFSL